MPLARAGDDALERPINTAAPLEIPHSLNVVLAEMARKRNRKPDNIESHSFLDLTPGLNPVIWPKYSDVRARLVTPEVKRTPVVGWIAENLYRSKDENGWCRRARSGRWRIPGVLPLPPEALRNGAAPIFLGAVAVDLRHRTGF